MTDKVAGDKIEGLRALAQRARRLADSITDSVTIANLRSYAEQLEEDIARLSPADALPAQALPAVVGNEPVTGPGAIAALIEPKPDESL